MDLSDLKMDGEYFHGIETRNTAQNIAIPRPERKEIIDKIEEDSNRVHEAYQEILEDKQEPVIELGEDYFEDIVSHPKDDASVPYMTEDQKRRQEFNYYMKEAAKERGHKKKNE